MTTRRLLCEYARGRRDFTNETIEGGGLGGADLRGLILRGARLHQVDCHGTDLSHTDLRGADLYGTTFRDAKLRGVDLREATGLTPCALEGADLTGASVDAALLETGRDNLNELAREARTLVLTLLAAVGYATLVLSGAEHRFFLSSERNWQLPIVAAAVDIRGWFIALPVMLGLVFVYTHVLVTTVAADSRRQPAVMPDGSPRSHAIGSLLIRSVVELEAGSKRVREPFRLARTVALILAVWVAVPLTVFRCWADYLPTKDRIGIGVGILVLVTTLVVGLYSFGSVRGGATARVLCRGATIGLAALLSAAALGLISCATFSAIPKRVAERYTASERSSLGMAFAGALCPAKTKRWRLPSKRCDQEATRKLIENDPGHCRQRQPGFWTSLLFELPPSAYDISNQDVARYPDKAADVCSPTSGLTRVRVHVSDLQFLRARSAFLANVDIRQANLRGADFSDSVLCRATAGRRQGRPDEEQTVLEGAVLQRADLRFTDFDRAVFRAADLEGARLDGASFVDAKLQFATLRDAWVAPVAAAAGGPACAAERLNLRGVDASCIVAVGAKLMCADASEGTFDDGNLTKIDLRDATLTRASFRRANLQEAHFEGADVDGAVFDDADVSKATFTNASKLTLAQIQKAKNWKNAILPADLAKQSQAQN